MALRAQHRSMVRGTAAAEALLAHVGRVMGRRMALFRNRRRLDIVLGLMCVQVAHKADPVACGGRIRGFVEERGGWTGMTRATWPQWRDRGIGQSSIDTMLRDADLRAALEAGEEAREDKRRSATVRAGSRSARARPRGRAWRARRAACRTEPIDRRHRGWLQGRERVVEVGDRERSRPRGLYRPQLAPPFELVGVADEPAQRRR
jgi:hypothetical protein